MSGQAQRRPTALDLIKAVAEAPLNKHQKAVLQGLAVHADYAGGTLTCFPSLRRLCRNTGLSETTLRRAIDGLEEAGAVSREYTRGGSRVMYRISLARLLDMACPPSTEWSEPVDGEAATINDPSPTGGSMPFDPTCQLGSTGHYPSPQKQPLQVDPAPRALDPSLQTVDPIDGKAEPDTDQIGTSTTTTSSVPELAQVGSERRSAGGRGDGGGGGNGHTLVEVEDRERFAALDRAGIADPKTRRAIVACSHADARYIDDASTRVSQLVEQNPTVVKSRAGYLAHLLQLKPQQANEWLADQGWRDPTELERRRREAEATPRLSADAEEVWAAIKYWERMDEPEDPKDATAFCAWATGANGGVVGRWPPERLKRALGEIGPILGLRLPNRADVAEQPPTAA